MAKKKVSKVEEAKKPEVKAEVIEEVKAVKKDKDHEKDPETEEVTNPVTYEEHLRAGFVTSGSSETLQKQGKIVVEIKNVEGNILHRLE